MPTPPAASPLPPSASTEPGLDAAPPSAPSPLPSAAQQPSALKPAAGGGSSGGSSFAERAFHPEEIRESGGALVVDIEYYLGQQVWTVWDGRFPFLLLSTHPFPHFQVHPVVSRLCAPIEGTDGAHIADCLGLDPSRFRWETRSVDPRKT